MGLGESCRVVGKGKVAHDEADEVKMCHFMWNLTDSARGNDEQARRELTYI